MKRLHGRLARLEQRRPHADRVKGGTCTEDDLRQRLDEIASSPAAFQAALDRMAQIAVAWPAWAAEGELP